MEILKKRNIYGTCVAFVLGLLFNGLGTVTMVLRELWQSRKYGFDIEVKDVVRYSLISALGSVVNVIILIMIL